MDILEYALKISKYMEVGTAYREGTGGTVWWRTILKCMTSATIAGHSVAGGWTGGEHRVFQVEGVTRGTGAWHFQGPERGQ